MAEPIPAPELLGSGAALEKITADFVEQRFPAAELAILAGSTARGNRTATSDLDLLLIGPATMFDQVARDHDGQPGRESLAATYHHRGEVIELFAYTPQAFQHWADLGVAESRPVIVDMLCSGLPLRVGGLAQLRARWQPILDAGPTPDPARLAQLRYAATDLLDDLADASDPFEIAVIGHSLVQNLATALLLAHGQWTGSGKHLVRQLRDWRPEAADELGTALVSGDRAALVTAAARWLRVVGGRLQAGHIR